MNKPTDTEINNLILVVTLVCRTIYTVGVAIRNHSGLADDLIALDIKDTLKKIK
jgi:hypothetical protein